MAFTVSTGNTTTVAAPTTPVATGLAFPVASGASVNHLYGYNPKRYSGKILRKFYESCVLTQISNTDYEGEIKAYGDTVIIRTTPDIVVADYKKGMDLDYKVYDTETVELTIDKGKYWAFVTNPLDQKQTDIKSFVEKWTSEAALRIKIAIEKEVFTYLIAATGDAANSGASAGKLTKGYDLGTTKAARSITKDTVLGAIVDCGSVLAEQDIPVQSEECWMVVDQKFANVMANSDLKSAMVMGDGKSLLLKGGNYNVPKIDCFNIYRSNVLPQSFTADSEFGGYVLFGHKSALTFAAQLTENESLPNPNGFGTLHRGLTVYGFKLVQPKAFGKMVVKYA